MKKPDFLNELKAKGKLKLVEPSDEICMSYLQKADNCMKSAKLLFENNLYENSISMSYYAMYNSLTALLFKTGIKCENHAGSIILFRKLFERKDLFKIILFAKKERIDKQYYVISEKDFVLMKESAKDMVIKAEAFLVKMKLLIAESRNEHLKAIRKQISEGKFVSHENVKKEFGVK